MKLPTIIVIGFNYNEKDKSKTWFTRAYKCLDDLKRSIIKNCNNKNISIPDRETVRANAGTIDASVYYETYPLNKECITFIKYEENDEIIFSSGKQTSGIPFIGKSCDQLFNDLRKWKHEPYRFEGEGCEISDTKKIAQRTGFSESFISALMSEALNYKDDGEFIDCVDDLGVYMQDIGNMEGHYHAIPIPYKDFVGMLLKRLEKKCSESSEN